MANIDRPAARTRRGAQLSADALNRTAEQAHAGTSASAGGDAHGLQSSGIGLSFSSDYDQLYPFFARLLNRNAYGTLFSWYAPGHEPDTGLHDADDAGGVEHPYAEPIDPDPAAPPPDTDTSVAGALAAAAAKALMASGSLADTAAIAATEAGRVAYTDTSAGSIAAATLAAGDEYALVGSADPNIVAAVVAYRAAYAASLTSSPGGAVVLLHPLSEGGSYSFYYPTGLYGNFLRATDGTGDLLELDPVVVRGWHAKTYADPDAGLRIGTDGDRDVILQPLPMWAGDLTAAWMNSTGSGLPGSVMGTGGTLLALGQGLGRGKYAMNFHWWAGFEAPGGGPGDTPPPANVFTIQAPYATEDVNGNALVAGDGGPFAKLVFPTIGETSASGGVQTVSGSPYFTTILIGGIPTAGLLSRNTDAAHGYSTRATEAPLDDDAGDGPYADATAYHEANVWGRTRTDATDAVTAPGWVSGKTGTLKCRPYAIGGRVTYLGDPHLCIESVSAPLDWTAGVLSLSGTTGLASGGTGADLSATGGAGNVLQQMTAGAAVTSQQLQLKTGSGAPATTPADGTVYMDTTNHKLYVRSGGAWKSVTLT